MIWICHQIAQISLRSLVTKIPDAGQLSRLVSKNLNMFSDNLLDHYCSSSSSSSSSSKRIRSSRSRRSRSSSSSSSSSSYLVVVVVVVVT